MMKSNQRRTALIRADGGKEIGMGHLNRTSLVAGMLRQRFGLMSKIVARQNPQAQQFLERKGLEAIFISPSLNREEEISFIRNFLQKKGAELYVSDVLHQEDDPRYLAGLRSRDYPLIAITDAGHKLKLDADIVVNGNPKQLNQDYAGAQGRYLLGPMFFLMDASYAQAKAKEPAGKIEKILISMGGSDHNDLLFIVLDVFKKLNADLSFLILSSEASGYLGRLKKYLATSGLKFKLLVDVESLASFWAQCDFAITAGGNTLFERIASRLAGATVCQLERQMEIADCFESLGVNVNLGFGPRLTKSFLEEKIRNLLADNDRRRVQYEKCPLVTDGKGLERLSQEISKVFNR